MLGSIIRIAIGTIIGLLTLFIAANVVYVAAWLTQGV